MDKKILEEYGIWFSNKPDKCCKQIIVSDLSYCLCGYLNIQLYPYYLSNELLPEIEKAIAQQPYESDGGGDGVFLEIGYPSSKFISGGGVYKVTQTIPTIDLKKILLLWAEFLNK